MISADDVPIDILENMRGRSTREHVCDDAVSREIERRLVLSFFPPTGNPLKLGRR